MSNADMKKIEAIRQYVESATLGLQEAKSLLEELCGDRSTTDALNKAKHSGVILATNDGSKVVEGVFDGQTMVGPDGKQYSIPANYASKSKLVEGDLLKLTIATNGSFIYKQIGPVERKRIRGKLAQDHESGEFRVIAEGKSYQVLTASITYFKGEAGDDVVILVPRDKVTAWAAVENIIHGGDGMEEEGTEESPAGLVQEMRPDHELPTAPHHEELPPADTSAEAPQKPPSPPSPSYGIPATPQSSISSPSLTPPSPLAPQPTHPLPSSLPPTKPSPSAPLQFDDDKDEFEEI